MNRNETIKFAAEIRMCVLDCIASIGSGHLGGSMSVADLIAVLYRDVMRVNPADPSWEGRDYLVLSKGHCGPALYAALALKGFFGMDKLKTLNRLHTRLPSHCDRQKTPGVDMTTGSLGQGVSSAAGIALGNRLRGGESYTYLICGDGEMQEGQVWEGVMFAAQQKLSRLVMLVDFNRQQLDGRVEDICSMENLDTRLSAFGFYAQRVDGHDVEAIYRAIEEAKRHDGGPSAIVLETEKGHGCNISEGAAFNHYMNVSLEQAEAAKRDIWARCLAAIGEV